jgi:RNA polymerase sigma-70 factor (ECF subfamily)
VLRVLVPPRAEQRLAEQRLGPLRAPPDPDPARPFLAWAYCFAYLEVLKQRERNQRGSRHLCRELVERLAREREQYEPVLLERLQALELCLRELPPADQELIRQRYQGQADIEELARQAGTSRRTLFRELDRIRRSLFTCINRRLAALDW